MMSFMFPGRGTAIAAVLAGILSVAILGLGVTLEGPEAPATSVDQAIPVPVGGTLDPEDSNEPTLPPQQGCGPSQNLTGTEISRNAQFTRFANVKHVIHFLPAPFEGGDTHYVGRKQPMLVGFEWAGGTVSDLDASINDPNHDIRIVVDGSPVAASAKQYYQPAFIAATKCGPNWSWDHDSDGPGDGDGDGIDDWSGAVLFWRAPLTGLSPGSHVLSVEVTFDGGATWTSYPGGTIVVR